MAEPSRAAQMGTGQKLQRPKVSVTVEERMAQDPILAEHFAGLETPRVELVPDPFRGTSPRKLHTSHRLFRSTDSAGIKYVNQYIVIKVLGHGTYGKVKLCLNAQDCKLYAIKIVDRHWLMPHWIPGETNNNFLEDCMREIAILKKLNHPNIVALHEVIDDENQKKLYLVLEYVEGGPIMGHTDQWIAIPEHSARQHFRDICQGLDYLHYHKILHRDLKPQNLLQGADGKIKISDFGVSQMFEKSDAITSTAGTPAFLAPEVCSEGSYQGRPVDIWALGVCLYVLVFAAIPFPAKSIPEMYHDIIHKELVFPMEHKVSKELKALLVLILTKDPDMRISLSAIMQHAWVSSGGMEPLAPFTMGPLMTGVPMLVSDDEVNAAYTSNSLGLEMLFNVGVEERHYERGDYIIRQGEEGHEMFFINSGKCEVLVESSTIAELSGEKVEYAIAERGPGQFVGEMALFLHTRWGEVPRRNASIRAKTHVVTLVVNKEQVMNVLAKDPHATQTMKNTISIREQETLNKMLVLQQDSPHTRDNQRKAKARCLRCRCFPM